MFFHQESLDQQNKSKLDQDQIQSLKAEIARIKSIEQDFEDIKVSFFVAQSRFHVSPKFSCLEENRKKKNFFGAFFRSFLYHFLRFLI